MITACMPELICSAHVRSHGGVGKGDSREHALDAPEAERDVLDDWFQHMPQFVSRRKGKLSCMHINPQLITRNGVRNSVRRMRCEEVPPLILSYVRSTSGFGIGLVFCQAASLGAPGPVWRNDFGSGCHGDGHGLVQGEQLPDAWTSAKRISIRQKQCQAF